MVEITRNVITTKHQLSRLAIKLIGNCELLVNSLGLTMVERE